MALPTFDTQEDVPEAFRGEYEERDGKWVAKEAGDGALAASKKALSKERELREKEERNRKAADDARKTAEDALAEAERLAEATNAGVTGDALKELRKKVEGDVAKAHEAELQDLRGQLEGKEATDAEIRRLKVDEAAKKLMLENGVRGNRVASLFGLQSGDFDLTDDGKTLILKEHPTKDIAVHIQDTYKEMHPWAFKGTEADGGGAGGHRLDGPPVSGTTAKDVGENPRETLAAARAAKAKV